MQNEDILNNYDNFLLDTIAKISYYIFPIENENYSVINEMEDNNKIEFVNTKNNNIKAIYFDDWIS